MMRAVKYACMDPLNRAPSYAAARCAICGCATDLIRLGLEFSCRGMHHFKNWDDILEQMVEIAEPVAAGLSP